MAREPLEKFGPEPGIHVVNRRDFLEFEQLRRALEASRGVVGSTPGTPLRKLRKLRRDQR